MNRIRTILIPVFLLVGCNGDAERLAAEAPPSLKVHKAHFQTRLSLSGSLVAANSDSINAPADAYGLTIRWMAEDGSEVKEGDKVLEMDTSAVVSQIDALESAVLEAGNALAAQHNTNLINISEKEHLLRQAEFELQKAQLDANVPADAYPKRTYEDMQLALGRAKVAHVGAVEALAMERKIGKNSLEQARIKLERSKRELKQVYGKLESYVLRAPRDGVLVAAKNWRENRAFRNGDKTWPGQPVVEIPDFSSMTVEAQLSDVDDGRVHVGMEAECRLDAYPDEIFKGHVISISPVARQARWKSLRQVFDVVVRLETTDPDRMRPGMSARVDILSPVQEGVLVSPRQALVFDEEGTRARLASGKEQTVTLGQCNAHECVVVSGLTEGTVLRSGEPQ